MCKYCEYVHFTVGGEQINNGEVMSIQNGSNMVILDVFRYLNTKDSIRDNNLGIYWGIKEPSGEIRLMDIKTIPIKYCPFCGEEL